MRHITATILTLAALCAAPVSHAAQRLPLLFTAQRVAAARQKVKTDTLYARCFADIRAIADRQTERTDLLWTRVSRPRLPHHRRDKIRRLPHPSADYHGA